MQLIRIKNGRVITPGALLKDADVLIEGTKIAAVGPSARPPSAALLRTGVADCYNIDAKGLFVAPGFIDTHIHGEPGTVLANEVKYGTTSAVLALSCDRPDRIYSKIDRIARFINTAPLGKAILGVRIEGPYINKRRAGAQDKRHIIKPNKRGQTTFLKRFIKGVRPLLKIITIAPELKGARPLLALLKKSGVIASIGHSDATYEEALAGFDSGITHATHLFNAMSGFDPSTPRLCSGSMVSTVEPSTKASLDIARDGLSRDGDGARHKYRQAGLGPERGVATAALLDERVTAEVILDLIHFHPKLFRLLLKVKDINRIILITDSVRAEIQKDVKKIGGVYRFADGRIAGSALTMIQSVRNAVNAGGLSIIDAVRCATQNPARLLGIESRKGSIAVGKDADIVIFDQRFDVKMTIINGNIAYDPQSTKYEPRKRGARCAG